MTKGTWTGSASEVKEISNIQRKQDGEEFTCEASNSAGSSRKSVRITVQYGPDFSLASNALGREGTSVSIVATVSANPAPTGLNWKRAGSETVLSTSRTLLIENATREDTGVYVLEATSVRQRDNNRTEEITKNASVHVQIRHGPASASLSPNITMLELDIGSSISRITCTADCLPTCDFKWTQRYRNTQRERSVTAYLDLGKASTEVIGEHTCEAYNNIGGQKYSASVTFQLRVKYAPTIQTVAINQLSNTPFNESAPIRVTAVIRAYPAPNAVTWGIKNDRFANLFKPLTDDSRYYTNRTSDCSYDCESTEVVTLNPPSCIDTGNKYSLYAANEKGNSSVKTTLNRVTITCIPRRVYYSFTYLSCEGEELNMTASFVSVPGPFISWYKQPDNRNYVYYEDFRWSWNTAYYTSRYHVQRVTSLTFGTYMVGAENDRGVSNSRVLVQVNRKSTCAGSVGDSSSSTTLSITTVTNDATSLRTPYRGEVVTRILLSAVMCVVLILVKYYM